MEDSSLLDRVRAALDYDPETGYLTWKVSTRATSAGARAGTLAKSGKRTIGFGRRVYLEHRLIWFIVTGRWPDPEVDRKNQVKSDNRWCNLREATRRQNQQNRSYVAKSSDLPRGVHVNRQYGYIYAQIRVDGRKKHLGVFGTIAEAKAAREQAEKQQYGSFAPAGDVSCR